MNEERVNFKIFRWSFNSACMNKRNMCFKVKKKLEFLRCEEYFSIDRPHDGIRVLLLPYKRLCLKMK